jgi:site-specific DNA-methyltransferase (adenine-specific)/site-specific DNA-methyltransferase (cytosine-N4-specific)
MYLGNALTLLPDLAPASIGCVVTSPPYAMQRKDFYASIEEADYPAWTVAWLDALRPALAPGASVLINIREHIRDGVMADYVHRTRLAVREAGWFEHEELVWCKPDAPPLGPNAFPRRAWERVLWFSQSRRPYSDPKANGTPSKLIGMRPANPGIERVGGHSDGYRDGIARCTNVITIPVGGNTSRLRSPGHTAAFPPALAAWLIRLACPPGATVLDPFAGSGSSGLAAMGEGRSFVGIELDAPTFWQASERLHAYVVAKETPLAS